MTGPKVLIACSDSELRSNCFNRVSALGVRVDAVGDQRSLSRRLKKDEYVMVLHDGALEIPSELEDCSHLIEPGGALDLALEERVRTILEIPERAPEENEGLPEGNRPPWESHRGRDW
ncbi:MAG: hypothetical protein VX764_07130 [Planctomycetota bacterium]|nr:hypothetical protein [Planctomycetota bacterium]